MGYMAKSASNMVSIRHWRIDTILLADFAHCYHQLEQNLVNLEFDVLIKEKLDMSHQNFPYSLMPSYKKISKSLTLTS